MCYTADVPEVFICRCVRFPARCTAARVRFRAATTFEGKLAAPCPEGERRSLGPLEPWALDYMATKDVCAWCWERRRRVRERDERAGRGAAGGTARGGRGGRRGCAASSASAGRQGNRGEEDEDQDEDEEDEEDDAEDEGTNRRAAV